MPRHGKKAPIPAANKHGAHAGIGAKMGAKKPRPGKPGRGWHLPER